MAIARWFTTDKIIAIGLVVALILSLFIGGNEKLQNDIAIGLVGFLGRGFLDSNTGGKALEKKAGDSNVSDNKK